ncbi:MAG: HEAT repeat domain-containing protein [Bacteroidota bacterium]
MQDINIQKLLDQYRRGPLTADQEVLLEQALEQGLIQLEQLEDLQKLQEQIQFEAPEVDNREERAAFWEALQAEQKHAAPTKQGLMERIFQFFSPVQITYSLALLVFGLALGLWLRPATGDNQQIGQLSAEVQQMKEMMMLTMLDKPSSSERLKAVSMSQDINEASEAVVNALFRTLNQDKNVNVRLATIEALSNYADSPSTRQRLIKSIRFQDSPLVQMALAELMVRMQERGSIDALEQLLGRDNVPEEVKTKIKSSIDILL